MRNCSKQFILPADNRFAMPLAVHQSGHPDIQLTAHYSSEPLAVHQKLNHQNGPGGSPDFGISQGLNLIAFNHGWVSSGLPLTEDGGIFGLGYHLGVQQ
jgi:hypothetical protein